MKIYRVSHNNQARWAIEQSEGALTILAGEPFLVIEPTTEVISRASAKLLAPAAPSKIVAVGRNYREHAKELGNDVPQEPLLFLKPPSSIIGPNEEIILPKQSQRVEHEAELAIIIGKHTRSVSVEAALGYVFGYTCANDVTARDLQKKDVQFTRGKGFDTFCPLGPCIETELNPQDVSVRCLVNEQVKQDGHTRDMVFSVAVLVAYISEIMTLEAGDVILTGTPSGVSQLQSKDRVSVALSGVGVLTNPVR